LLIFYIFFLYFKTEGVHTNLVTILDLPDMILVLSSCPTRLIGGIHNSIDAISLIVIILVVIPLRGAIKALQTSMNLWFFKNKSNYFNLVYKIALYYWVFMIWAKKFWWIFEVKKVFPINSLNIVSLHFFDPQALINSS